MAASASKHLLALGVLLAGHSGSAQPLPGADVHFARDVLPILRARCFECHGPRREKGGLRLDIRERALRGGDSGPVILPGRSRESRLVQLIAGLDGDDRMPPRGEPLEAMEIETVRAWIDAGAEWPAEIQPAGDPEGGKASDLWSLRPLAKPPVPEVRQTSWVRNPIDRFVLAKLEEEGLEPSPETDAGTLIRRLSFDLCGLPPAPGEVDSFASDQEPFAYEKLVERLLASPRYGERWGRHWLDVVRYTESQGFEYDRPRPNAWHYREYVIASFNSDRPYDSFVRQQVAGDVLEPVSRDGIVATSFLVCGAWDQAGSGQANLTQRMITREEEMEDLVSAVTQTFLGITANCARCHSHKFDPVPQEDYYRIKAVFDGVVHGEREVASAREKRRREERLAELESEIRGARGEVAAIEAIARVRVRNRRTPASRAGSAALAPLARWSFEDGTARDDVAGLDGTLRGAARIASGRLITDGKDAFLETAPLSRDLGAKTLVAVVYLSTLDQGGGAALSIETSDGAVFDAIVFGERERRKWIAGSDSFRRTRDLDAPAETAGPEEPVHMAAVYHADGKIALYRNGEPYGSSWRPSPAVTTFPAGGARALLGRRHTGGGRAFLAGAIDEAAIYDRALSPEKVRSLFASSPAAISRDQLVAVLSEEERARHHVLERAVAAFERERALVPPLAVSYTGIRRQPAPTRRLVRGDVREPAEEVAPGALSAVRAPDPDFGLAPDAPEGERRRRFAEWLADPRNPLVARVMVNRVWHYHFGRGLAGTPNDLGNAGDPPSHPELLDWLGATFIEEGWSLKALHRRILCSATYRQSSLHRARAAAADAANRWLWRFPPRRIEAEAMRDAMLAASGALHLRMGGPSFQPFSIQEFGSTFYELEDRSGPEYDRRTVYRMNVHSGKDPLLEAFDCAEPSVKTPRRTSTITPLQALGLMNNTFVLRQARAMAERVVAESRGDSERAVILAYRYAFARPPAAGELERGTALAAAHGMDTLCWALFNASEFLTID